MSEPLPDYSFYRHIIDSLEQIGAPYMLIGGFVAAALGSTRTTFDIDIVVDLDEIHIERLVERYPPPRYYADPHHIRECIRNDIMFNIIDAERGQKADLVPVGMNALYRQALGRRVRLSFEDVDGSHFEAWAARPEDIIIGKLLAWDEGRSFRHELDIRSILLFLYAGLDPDLTAGFDETMVDRAAAQIGPAVAHLWETLKAAAELELRARRRR